MIAGVAGLVVAALAALAVPALGFSAPGRTTSSSYRNPGRAATRLVVLYHPDLSSCQPQEIRALRALSRIATDHAEVEVATVLPEGKAALAERYGLRLPGRSIRIPARAFVEEGTWAPRPRIEAWSRDGTLLLLIGLHPAIREERVLDGVLWARSFTEPAPQEAR